MLAGRAGRAGRAGLAGWPARAGGLAGGQDEPV